MKEARRASRREPQLTVIQVNREPGETLSLGIPAALVQPPSEDCQQRTLHLRQLFTL